MNEIHTLYNNQEETHIRERLQERCRQNFRLVIRRFHVHAINLSVYLDTGSGQHRRLLNVSELAESLGEEYCATLLGFCVFFGEFCTKQYLQEKGKVGPIRIIIIIRQPLCPVVGRRPQHAVSKLPCLVLSSAISCRSIICPGRLSIAWLVSLVVFSCHMVSNW